MQRFIKTMAVLLAVGVVAVNCRPEAANKLPETKDAKIGTPVDTESINLPAEARSVDEAKTLSYYGGALGRYLVIHPSGKMSILGEARPPPGRKGDSEEEEDVGVAEDEGPDDTVAVNHPPDNASIAEAKPVAVSIAGVGGVASAQPVATAVVGPGGLAVTRPVGTAVSGVQGAENVLGILTGGGKSPPQQNFLYSVVQPQPLFYYRVPLYNY